MNGDLENAVSMLAADNARLCDIGIAADKLAEEVERLLEDEDRGSPYLKWRLKILWRALEAYKVVRNGQ